MPNGECRMANASWQMPNAECRMPRGECRMANAECRMPDLSRAWRDLLCATRDLFCAWRDLSCAWRDLLCATRDLSCATRDLLCAWRDQEQITWPEKSRTTHFVPIGPGAEPDTPHTPHRWTVTARDEPFRPDLARYLPRASKRCPFSALCSPFLHSPPSVPFTSSPRRFPAARRTGSAAISGSPRVGLAGSGS